MYCEKCGYDVTDGSEFCPQCGEKIHIPEPKFSSQKNINYSENIRVKDKDSGVFSEQKLSRDNGLSAAITIKDWLKLNCVGLFSLIPVVGTIVYLVVYLVIGFSEKTAISIKNNIKANLIWSLIITGVAIVLLIIFSSVIVGLFSSNFQSVPSSGGYGVEMY